MATQLGAHAYGLELGSPVLASAGPITFGPAGILFVADNTAAKIVAIDVGDNEKLNAPVVLDDLDSRLAAYFGCPRDDIAIRDMAVHPLSLAVYLAVVRGSGSASLPVLVRIGKDGTLDALSLDQVNYAETPINDAPSAGDEREDGRVVADYEPSNQAFEYKGIHLRLQRDPLRTQTVTDLAYVDGLLLVAGASNEEFVSTLRRIPFPFGADPIANSLEIFHVSHGKWETHAPLRTFVAYGGGESVLAAYTCTPVVHFSVAELVHGEHARGRTVAELGSMNTPLDMASYSVGGEEYVLVSNARHPLFRLASRGIEAQEGLTTPKEPTGVARVELPHEGVSRLATCDDHVLMLQWIDGGLHLRSYETSSL